MKQFLAVFLGSPSSPSHAKWDALDAKTKQEKINLGKAAWHNWVQENKKFIVYIGGPLGRTKKIDKSGIHEIKNMLAAYTVMQGESYEEVAKLFLNHPHYSIFPGDSVEIMEVLSIPV